MSILDPLACGFAKVIIYSVITETHNLVKNEDEPHTKYLKRIYVWQFDKIKRILGGKFFHVEYNSKFKEKFNQIKDNITDLNKRSPKTKNEVLATFSEEKWKKLLDERDKHTMFDCKGCFKSKTLKIALSKFPIKSKVYRLKARNAGLFKETELKEVTNTIINNLDKSFQSKYRTTFTAQMKKILTSTPKESKHSIAKSITKDIEEQVRETAVER